MKRLDRTSSIPLHAQLEQNMREDIVSGSYGAGSLFPTEREIAETYHVSRTTIRSAMEELVRLGFLTRQQGKGTFVTRSRKAFDATRLSSFTEDMEKEGRVAAARVLAFRREPPPAAAQDRFRTTADGSGRSGGCGRRTVSRSPSRPPHPGANRYQLAAGGGWTNAWLYELLNDKYGVVTTSADEVITAQVANRRDAGHLQIRPGEPLLCVDRFAFTQHGEPLEFVQIQYRADRYRFFVHQHRGG